MASRKTVLTFARLLALMGTFVMLALGIWSVIIVRNIEDRQNVVLESVRSRLGSDTVFWSHFIAEAAKGAVRVSVLVAMSSVAALNIILTVSSNRYYWLRISPTVTILIELVSTTSIAIVLGCALSFTLNLKAFSTSSFETYDSADLAFFALLNPLSKAITITAGIVSILLVTACTMSLLDMHKLRRQSRDIRSFEPTISALGMSHGFHALHPPARTKLEPIPTVYDPYKAFQTRPGKTSVTKNVAFVNEGAWMNRKHSRWSVSTTSPVGIEGDIMRLLDVKRARRAIPVRPAQTWNET